MKKFVISILSLVFLFSATNPWVYAQSQEERLQEIQQQQADLQNKISNARSNIKTLNGQIGLMDDKIRLTGLQIASTEQKIGVLETDIGVLSQKIGRVEDSYTLLQQTLLHRIQTTYAIGEPSEAELLLNADDFSQSLLSYQYLAQLQKNDLKLLGQMSATKQNYGDQKASLQDKQTQLEKAKADLDAQNNQLSQQKSDKEKLLTTTKDDEKRYQQLYAQLASEAQAIENAIANSANLTNGVHVDKGQVIALMGNSGAPSCSTGAHLHFEVWQNGSRIDPAAYLRNIGAQFDNSPDGSFGFSGQSDWPLPDPVITQGYGMTYWARTGFYGGGPHTGIDMISHTSIAIHSVTSGTLYKASTMCGSSVLKYAVVDSGNGTKIYYLHIQ